MTDKKNNRRNRFRLQVLQRRIDYLASLRHRNSFLDAELSALEWAIEICHEVIRADHE